jgi:sugar phosphate isomerase/epimerase
VDRSISVLRALGIGYCEIRSVEGVSALSLGHQRQRDIHRRITDSGLSVAVLDSQVGRADIRQAVAGEADLLKRALEWAVELQAAYLRVYSFVLPDVDGAADHNLWREQVIARMAGFVELAKGSGVKLLVENLPGSFCSRGDRVSDLLTSVGSPWLGAVFDPAGFVASCEHPFLVSFKPGPGKNYVRCLRIRDATFAGRKPVLPDQGNAELRELISALLARGFEGFFSVDHGLESSPDSFRAAYQAFAAMLSVLA